MPLLAEVKFMPQKRHTFGEFGNGIPSLGEALAMGFEDSQKANDLKVTVTSSKELRCLSFLGKLRAFRSKTPIGGRSEA